MSNLNSAKVVEGRTDEPTVSFYFLLKFCSHIPWTNTHKCSSFPRLRRHETCIVVGTVPAKRQAEPCCSEQQTSEIPTILYPRPLLEPKQIESDQKGSLKANNEIGLIQQRPRNRATESEWRRSWAILKRASVTQDVLHSGSVIWVRGYRCVTQPFFAL